MAQTRRVIHAAHPVQLPNVDVVVPQHHRVRPVDIAPHRNEPALRVKNLNPVRLPVHHQNPVGVIHRDVVRADKLPGVNPRLPPAEPVIPVPAIDMDPGVAVAVRDINIPVGWPDGCRSRPVERLPAPFGRRMIPLPNLHHLLPIRGELLDGMDAVIRRQNGIVVGNVKPVGAVAEQPLPKGADKVTRLVKDHNRMFPPGQDKHPVLRVADHPGTFHQPHPLGQLQPVRHKGILEIAVAENFRHRFPSCSVKLSPYYLPGKPASNADPARRRLAARLRFRPTETAPADSPRCQ